jgi:threonine aldolase
MADALSAGLTAAGCNPVWPVEANEVFAPIGAALDRKLKAAGAAYYPWKSWSLPKDVSVPADDTLMRFVTSFQTTQEDVDRFLAVLRS